MSYICMSFVGMKKRSPSKNNNKIGYVILNEENWSKVEESIGNYGMAFGRVQPLFRFLNLSQEETAGITGVSSRTLARWGKQTAIGVTASERVAKIDHLIKTGIDVFKSESIFKNWFGEKNFSLGGKSPKEI